MIDKVSPLSRMAAWLRRKEASEIDKKKSLLRAKLIAVHCLNNSAKSALS